MRGWRESILNDFVPNVSRLTLVADPDSLLTEETLALELRRRGFELIEFNDPVEFRYAYESTYRAIWDRGEHTDLVVILRLQDTELESLPYDLLQAGRKLSFNLGNLFPNLSYPVLEQLDRSFLDALFEAQHIFSPDRMGDNATRDYILRHVFRVAAELIVTDVDLLRVLLRLHYSKIALPEILALRLVQQLRGQAGFHGWPLDVIVSDEEAFFAFLQERWPLFLGRISDDRQLREIPMKYQGPDYLPFDHHDIRVYIDNLFVEGKLHPVQKPGLSIDVSSWIRSGIVDSGTADELFRISRLFEIIEKEVPVENCRYSDWIAFALKWSELTALIHCGDNEEHKARFLQIGDTLNVAFAQWLSTHYSSIINLPPKNPAMLHHVSRRLARDMEDGDSRRVALIVVDGLALDQWISVRQILQAQNSSLVVKESAVFAWVPTLTSVSRQAIFSGKPPIYFPASIQSTNSESSLWKQFWEDAGLSRLDIAYQRGLGDGDVSAILDAVIHPVRTRALGLVVDKVDKIMHGMQLGAAGMHNQIKQWAYGGFLTSLIDYLLDRNYQVWMTSDHGNIECKGKGRPFEGVIAETRGERVRVYPTPELRRAVAREFPFARECEPIGLPQGYFPLIAGGRDAFVTPGTTIVGHGGVSIEEVIVPLIKFERGL
ncbi:MAG: BREX-3 system phosphatase PglZ [Chlorobiaceae bacterium]